jgi:uncharacterized protein YecT (DUF1311 family)
MRVAAAVALALLSSSALADDQPQPKDTAAVQSCVKAKGGRQWRWETCIGVVSEPCAKDEGSMRDAEVSACYDRERAVWDAVLNDSFRRLRAKLDDDQQGKLRDMQRSWITSRDKGCQFLYDYFQGTMANPMIAACLSRETGRRALYLLGFADDAEGK